MAVIIIFFFVSGKFALFYWCWWNFSISQRGKRSLLSIFVIAMR